MNENDRNPAIRIHIDQQVFIDAILGAEEIEDATVVTEVVGFDRSETNYVLEGALAFTGYVSQQDQEQKEVTTDDLVGDVASTVLEEDMTVQQIHCRMPFTLEVPISAQRTEFLNVTARAGTWNLHVLGPKWVHVRAELVVNGLTGGDGYRFRCGTQEEGFAAPTHPITWERSWPQPSVTNMQEDSSVQDNSGQDNFLFSETIVGDHAIAGEDGFVGDPESVASGSNSIGEQTVDEQTAEESGMVFRGVSATFANRDPSATQFEHSEPVEHHSASATYASVTEVTDDQNADSAGIAEDMQDNMEAPKITYHFEEVAESSAIQKDPEFKLKINSKIQQESSTFQAMSKLMEAQNSTRENELDISESIVKNASSAVVRDVSSTFAKDISLTFVKDASSTVAKDTSFTDMNQNEKNLGVTRESSSVTSGFGSGSGSSGSYSTSAIVGGSSPSSPSESKSQPIEKFEGEMGQAVPVTAGMGYIAPVEPVVDTFLEPIHVQSVPGTTDYVHQDHFIEKEVESKAVLDVTVSDAPLASVTIVEDGKYKSDQDRIFRWTELYPYLEDSFQPLKFRIVQEDETLERIAENYRIPTSEVVRVNQLPSEQIDIGQLLFIPVRK